MKKNDSFSLLCRCIQPGTGAELEVIAGNSEINWHGLMQAADRHFASTLLYYQLQKKRILHLLPEELKSLLEQIFSLNQQRNRLILSEVNHIASLLNSVGIEPLFLKGCAGLIMEIYDDVGLRIMNDVDFMVDEKELSACVQAMEADGYYPMEEVNLAEDFYHLNPLIHDNHNIRFEIHKRLDLEYNPQLDSDTILAQSIVKKVKGGVVRVPEKSHFIIHNLLHHQLFNRGLFEENVPLYQLYDLYALREKDEQELDWKLIERFFKEAQFPDALYYPLGLLDKYYRQPPPAAIHAMGLRTLLIQVKRAYTRLTS